MCYSVINPCGYWTSATLFAFASNGTHRWEDTVQCDGCEKTYYASWSSESESISGAEINLTVYAVSNGVQCCNLAESKSVLKMCISKHCHKVTGFLSWIGTYCISCLVQQRSKGFIFSCGIWWQLVRWNKTC